MSKPLAARHKGTTAIRVPKQKHREQVVYMLLAAGWTDAEVAEKTKLSVKTVAILRQHGRLAVREMQGHLRRSLAEDWAAKIGKETMPSLDVLVRLRDRVDEDVDDRKLQRAAAKDLLELNPALQVKREAVEVTHRIVLAKEDLEGMRAAMGGE